ncbi:MAG: MBL fold metallo-hydrolase [Eubacterium sp.]|nr:MBL fold metallo-hydrolase [Eubacterium sp.]
MKLCSLSSGSSGNCIFAGSEEVSLLFDAGISGKKTENGLNMIGMTGKDLNGIFITHEHSDHIQGLGVLARKLRIPIYATKATCEAILAKGNVGKIPEDLFRPIEPDVQVVIGDITVEPFSISHDAADPVAYRISSGTHSAAIATDMGTYTDYTIRHLQNLDVLLLEANHDVNMLEAGRYPYYLKRRILSDRGHLSNEASGQLLSELLHDNMKRIILGHLSAENNYPALAYETVCSEVTMGDNPYRSGDFAIEVAKRDTVGDVVNF